MPRMWTKLKQNCKLLHNKYFCSTINKILGYWKTKNDPLNQLNLNANYIDLIYSIAIRHPLNIPPPPTILLPNSPIFDIFKENISSLQLQQIANTNFNSQQLRFYTDGSVKDITTDQCSSGIGWIQVDNNNNIIYSYSAQIKYWPSSYKAELVSILSVISTASMNCQIDIYTDSLSVILKFNKIKQQSPNPNKLSSFHYWPI